MVDVSLGWKVLKNVTPLFAFLITFKRFDTLGGYLKNKRKASHDFIFPTHYFQVHNKDGGALYKYPVYKKVFYFQRHYIMTIKEYHDISITHAIDSFWKQFST